MEMEDELIISDELIFDGLDGGLKEILKTVTDILYEKGIVKETYYEALLKREEEYPTGLACMYGNLAIPHTYSEHCNKSALVIIRPGHKIPFTRMDDHREVVDCGLIILMVVHKPEKQLLILQRLIKSLQEPVVFKTLCEEKSHTEVLKTLKKICEEGGETL